MPVLAFTQGDTEKCFLTKKGGKEENKHDIKKAYHGDKVLTGISTFSLNPPQPCGNVGFSLKSLPSGSDAAALPFFPASTKEHRGDAASSPFLSITSVAEREGAEGQQQRHLTKTPFSSPA